MVWMMVDMRALMSVELRAVQLVLEWVELKVVSKVSKKVGMMVQMLVAWMVDPMVQTMVARLAVGLVGQLDL